MAAGQSPWARARLRPRLYIGLFCSIANSSIIMTISYSTGQDVAGVMRGTYVRVCVHGCVQETLSWGESEFVRCVGRLSKRRWNCGSSSDTSSVITSRDLDLPSTSASSDLTLLHLAAALGWNQLVTSLIKWRSVIHPDDLSELFFCG